MSSEYPLPPQQESEVITKLKSLLGDVLEVRVKDRKSSWIGTLHSFTVTYCEGGSMSILLHIGRESMGGHVKEDLDVRDRDITGIWKLEKGARVTI